MSALLEALLKRALPARRPDVYFSVGGYDFVLPASLYDVWLETNQ